MSGTTARRVPPGGPDPLRAGRRASGRSRPARTPGFGEALVRGLTAAGPRDALVCGQERLSGDQVLAMTASAAAALEARGVRAGQAIALLYGGRPESLAARLVTLALGCPAILVPVGLPPETAARAMRATGATALLYEAGRQEDAEALLRICPVPVHGPLDRLLATAGAGTATIPAGRGLASVTFTNGTTGERKAVAYSHAVEAAQLGAARALIGPGAWRFLVWPGFHLPTLTALWTLATGGTAVLATGEDTGRERELIAREGVTHVLAGPPFGFYGLARRLGHVPGVRQILYGGAPAVPARSREAVEALGRVVRQSYGLTEGGFVTTLSPADHARPGLLASVGRAVAGVELEIRDERGARVPDGEVGEVWTRSPQVMTGYLDDPGLTAATLRDGWVRTGDLGRLTPPAEGRHLFLVDRAGSGLPPGVYAYPVEQVLTGHPGVSDAAVFALPDGGVGAAVAGRADEPELRELVRGALGPACEPRRLWLMDDLPRTGSGKPDKSALRARYGGRPG
ncbi:class I adenylate-forming enzyme family protein [Nonomuraea sp. NPDC023979]|uniref:class I adenylate-forming enzyme family protein n=1 Tax=Nonomuraea sp. NPDC023979 TaxID=3154796 RepID=UPI0033CAB21D